MVVQMAALRVDLTVLWLVLNLVDWLVGDWAAEKE